MEKEQIKEKVREIIEEVRSYTKKEKDPYSCILLALTNCRALPLPETASDIVKLWHPILFPHLLNMNKRMRGTSVVGSSHSKKESLSQAFNGSAEDCWLISLLLLFKHTFTATDYAEVRVHIMLLVPIICDFYEEFKKTPKFKEYEDF